MLMAELVRREEVKNGLTMNGSGRRCLAPVGASREGGRRADEGRLRCGIHWGWGALL
jgi:hypothetical protein